MSSSNPCNIPYVLNLVSKNIMPKIDFSKVNFKSASEGKALPIPKFKILDVGFGYGKWAFLIRDTFEVMFGQNFDKKDWKIKITGVEIFQKCITPLQKRLYNKIIQKEIFQALKDGDIKKYDLILLGDIVEHMEKEKAHKLLEELFKHSKNIIVSTPLGFLPQGAWAGNQYEIHKSGWEVEDFNRYKVMEYKLEEDTLFEDLIDKLDIPEERRQRKLKLIVIWLREK